MNTRQKLLTTTTILGLAAGGIAIFTTSDPSGGGQRAAKVLAKGCDVVITSPEADVTGTAKLSSGQSLAVTLTGKALRCPAGTVSVYATVGGGAESLLGTATVSAAGAWSYGPTTLTDNATTVLRAAMSVVVDDASRPSESRLIVDAATARPWVALTTPAPNGNGRAYIAAAAADGGCGGGGNPHAEKGEPGYYHDLSCTAGGQVNPVMTVYGGCQGHGDASYDAGCTPGTLTATYGVTPLASVAVTTDPQTFTSAELGQWTLDDWTRDDLVIRAAAGGDAGVAQVVVDLQVSTGSPPSLDTTVTVVENRGADFDISFALPSTPAPVAKPHIELYWTTSTERMVTGSVSRGVATITTTPTLVADPPTAGRGSVTICPIADGGTPVYCGNSPAVTPDGGTKIIPGVGSCNHVGDYNDCNGWPTPAPVYCVTASGTANVAVSDDGRCTEFTRDWANGSHTSNGFSSPRAYHVVACWGDGTETSDAGVAVQLWRCKDGKSYRGGETYVERTTKMPPLNTYFIHAEVIW